MDNSVLVGIVTRNRSQSVAKAIRSALIQTRGNIRVAVIDDASTDQTPDLKNQFPQVEWTRWDEGRGYMAARNCFMANATESFFASLDDDAWFLRGDELALACAAMDANPQIGAIAFDVLSPDRPEPAERMPQRPTAMFIGCGHMIRLEAARRVGFYEVSPGLYGVEEKDFCLRLIDEGYEIVFLPGVHVWHDKTSIERHKPSQHCSGVCNDLVMTVRRTPLLLLPAALLSKLYRHLLFGFRNGLLRPAVAGFTLFLGSIPAVWRSRKPVKASTLRTFLRLRTQ